MVNDDLAAGITFYQNKFRQEWDGLVNVAQGGSVLHSRRFLDYHGDRFEDLSLIRHALDGRKALGVFPIAAHPEMEGVAVSHAGSSFGGVISLSSDPLEKWRFLRVAAERLLDRGYQTLVYRSPPAALLQQADDGLLPALCKLGRLTRCDLWSVLRFDSVTVAQKNYWNQEIRRAERKGLSIHKVHDQEDWQLFHNILAQRLIQRYSSKPVHTAEELFDLHGRLGQQSRAVIVRDPQGADMAALWFIDYGCGTLHNQYNAATDAGLRLGASSYGIARALSSAMAEGCFKQFSFGRSTLEDGWSSNRNLMRFKERFGAGVCAQLHFEIDLAACCAAPDDFLSG